MIKIDKKLYFDNGNSMGIVHGMLLEAYRSEGSKTKILLTLNHTLRRECWEFYKHGKKFYVRHGVDGCEASISFNPDKKNKVDFIRSVDGVITRDISLEKLEKDVYRELLGEDFYPYVEVFTALWYFYDFDRKTIERLKQGIAV